MTDREEQLFNEVQLLKEQLTTAYQQLGRTQSSGFSEISNKSQALHTLMLLADSALPLGSFAFSSGLESYLAHHKGIATQQQPSLSMFLHQSVRSIASTSVPYIRATHLKPESLAQMDDEFDASMLCIVARRASSLQGRALLGLWDRSFKNHTLLAGSPESDTLRSLGTFSRKSKVGLTNPAEEAVVNAHLAPLWGAVTRALGVSEYDATYIFLFSHTRAVISAAVRASILGPYQAQAVLASEETKALICSSIDEWWMSTTEDAGQVSPMIDLWIGRHEKLYSRIFNS